METSATMLLRTIEQIESDYEDGIAELISIIESQSSIGLTSENIVFDEYQSGFADSLNNFLKSGRARTYLEYYGYKFYTWCEYSKKHWWNFNQNDSAIRTCIISWSQN